MSKFGISFTGEGFDQLLNELNISAQEVQEQIDITLADMALKTQEYAIKGIQQGPKTGRVYEYSDPTREHQSSAPGEYPATDTGGLVGSVKVELPQTDQTAYVGTKLDYGKTLEFGDDKIEPRPWLLPSFERARTEALDDLIKRIGNVI